MRRFASLLVILIIFTAILPHSALAQIPNEPPAFDRSPPSGTTITTLDSVGIVGQYISATIGADGLGIISYYDATNRDLKVAHCSNVACSTATMTTLDAAGNQGAWSAIALGADGLAIISYYDYSNYDLKVAHCSNVECTATTLATIDSAGDIGKYTSITIGADSLALISYLDSTNKDLKVAHCNDIVCSTATASVVDSEGIKGEYTSIALGSDGLALISYYGNANTFGSLLVSHCTNVPCSSAQRTVSSNNSGYEGQYSSLATGADGLGIISFYDIKNKSLAILHCATVPCSDDYQRPSVSGGNVGLYTSLSIGMNNLPVIAYYDMTQGDLKVAFCATMKCTDVQYQNGTLRPVPVIRTVTLDTIDNVGTYTSLTIGADGNPLVAYHDVTNGDLKVAHCSNPLCIPFFRRR